MKPGIALGGRAFVNQAVTVLPLRASIPNAKTKYELKEHKKSLPRAGQAFFVFEIQAKKCRPQLNAGIFLPGLEELFFSPSTGYHLQLDFQG